MFAVLGSLRYSLAAIFYFYLSMEDQSPGMLLGANWLACLAGRVGNNGGLALFFLQENPLKTIIFAPTLLFWARLRIQFLIVGQDISFQGSSSVSSQGGPALRKKTAPPIAPKDYQHPTIGKTRIPSFFNSSPWKITMLLSSVNHLFRLGPSIPKCPIEIDGLPINSMVIFHGELWVITRV